MDDTKNQLTKSKSPRQSRPFAIDFIVPIQLEDCVQRARKYTGDPALRVMIRPIEQQDRVEFDCDSRENGMLFMVGQGTMQRWQGTSTRVHIPLIYHHSDGKYRIKQAQPPIAVLALISTLVFYVFLTYQNFAEPIRWQLTCFWLFGFCLLSSWILLIVFAIVRYRQRRVFIRHLRHLLTS